MPGSGNNVNAIDDDARTINTLLESSKAGHWDTVWDIIGTPEAPKQAYLINVIPQNRRWAMLHQAVFWRRKSIMTRLLKFRALDINTRSKRCQTDKGTEGKFNASDIAKDYGYMDMHALLKTGKPVNAGGGDVCSTFQHHAGYQEKSGLALLSIAISAYKEAFHPKDIDPRKGITAVLQDIWHDIESSPNRWKSIRDVVADSVDQICGSDSRKIAVTSTKSKFYDAMIKIYTSEENFMYVQISSALRLKTGPGFCPSGDNLAVGPYVVMLQMLLMFWPEIPRFSGTSYRRMRVDKSDADKYTKGLKFVWTSIVSSSAAKNYAIAFPTCQEVTGDISIFFIINNGADSFWQPRFIENYAQYTEKERTYPAGAPFQITGRSGGQGAELKINLTLLTG